MVKSYIIFQISTNKAIIDIKNIQEIIVRPEKLTPVLDPLPYVEGLVNLRGEAIPIIDLRVFLNVEKSEEDKSKTAQTIMILKKGGEKLGMIVDDIYHVEEIQIDDEEVDENRNTLYNMYFPKVVKIEEELVSIFDAELIFDKTNF